MRISIETLLNMQTTKVSMLPDDTIMNTILNYANLRDNECPIDVEFMSSLMLDTEYSLSQVITIHLEAIGDHQLYGTLIDDSVVSHIYIASFNEKPFLIYTTNTSDSVLNAYFIDKCTLDEFRLKLIDVEFSYLNDIKFVENDVISFTMQDNSVETYNVTDLKPYILYDINHPTDEIAPYAFIYGFPCVNITNFFSITRLLADTIDDNCIKPIKIKDIPELSFGVLTKYDNKYRYEDADSVRVMYYKEKPVVIYKRMSGAWDDDDQFFIINKELWLEVRQVLLHFVFGDSIEPAFYELTHEIELEECVNYKYTI